MGNYSVYKHVSPSGKVYIGITGRKPEDRWANGKAYVFCLALNNAIKKYGWENFKNEVLFTGLSKSEAVEKEIELIKIYNATDSRFGYNIQNGGEGIGKHSEETKRKIGQANKGRSTWAKGKKFTKQHRENLRKSNLYKQTTARSVEQINKKGELVGVFHSIRDAERQTGINRRGISYVLNGTYQYAGGYHWKEVSNE